MTPLSVRELLDRQKAPEFVVLLGKGESLDAFLSRRRVEGRQLWIGLNEVMSSGITCDWGVYIDRRFEALVVPDAIQLIRPYYHAAHHGGRGFIVERKWLQSHGYNFHSSPSLAIHLCGIWGVKGIVMVGFDAYDDPKGKWYYAKSVKTLGYARCMDFTEVNRGITEALEATGIQPLWWHRGETL